MSSNRRTQTLAHSSDVDDQLPPREQQRRATRRRLLDAARAAFTEHGFGASTLEQITRRAGVNRGTLYLHFADKHELLLGLLETIDADYDQLYSQLREATSPRECMDFFAQMLERGAEVGPAFALAREAAATDDHVQKWIVEHQDSHTAALATLLERRGVNPPQAAARASALTAMFTELVGSSAAQRLHAPLEDLLEAVAQLFLAAATP